MGHRPAALSITGSGVRRRSLYGKLRPLFRCGALPVAQNAVYLPEEFLAQMRAAMPTHLSFDDFIAACQRPLRRSIRVNTLKITVADFLQLVAPIAGSSRRFRGAKRASGSSVKMKTTCRWAARPSTLAGCFTFRKPAPCCRSPRCLPTARCRSG